jgi:hypothetical protein
VAPTLLGDQPRHLRRRGRAHAWWVQHDPNPARSGVIRAPAQGLMTAAIVLGIGALPGIGLLRRAAIPRR